MHACRCCLVTERKQIEGRKLESTSSFIFLLARFLFLALTSAKIPVQAVHTQTHRVSLCHPPHLPAPLARLHSVRAPSLISSQGGCCPPVRKTPREGGQAEGRDRLKVGRAEKTNCKRGWKGRGIASCFYNIHCLITSY